MSNEAPVKKRKLGRPSTGVTVTTVTTCLPNGLAMASKRIAARNNESYSKFVARAVMNEVMNGSFNAN